MSKQRSPAELAKEAWDTKLRNAATGDVDWDHSQKDHKDLLISDVEALLKNGPAIAVTDREKAIADVIRAHADEVPEPVASSPESAHSKAKDNVASPDKGKKSESAPKEAGGFVSRSKE